MINAPMFQNVDEFKYLPIISLRVQFLLFALGWVVIPVSDFLDISTNRCLHYIIFIPIAVTPVINVVGAGLSIKHITKNGFVNSSVYGLLANLAYLLACIPIFFLAKYLGEIGGRAFEPKTTMFFMSAIIAPIASPIFVIKLISKIRTGEIRYRTPFTKALAMLGFFVLIPTTLVLVLTLVSYFVLVIIATINGGINGASGVPLALVLIFGTPATIGSYFFIFLCTKKMPEETYMPFSEIMASNQQLKQATPASGQPEVAP